MNKNSVSGLGEAVCESGYKVGADVVYVFGAPNDYERSVRLDGSSADLLEHASKGQEPDTLAYPSEYEDSIEEELSDSLHELGIDSMSVGSDLSTTADDIVSALEITGSNDTVHGHTSDYHARPADVAMEYASDRQETRVFGHRTKPSKREKIWKHNGLTQTVLNTPRQLYKLARRDQDF